MAELAELLAQHDQWRRDEVARIAALPQAVYRLKPCCPKCERRLERPEYPGTEPQEVECVCGARVMAQFQKAGPV